MLQPGALYFRLQRQDKMMASIAFLYFALPVLSSGATGALAGYRMTCVGLVRGGSVGIGMGLIGIAANIGYGFLWEGIYEWRYPSVVQLSETRRVFYNYGNHQQEREFALMIGPVVIAGFLAAGTWLACRWWNKR